MNNLKFELSVLFTKKERLNPLSGNKEIALEYHKMFGKEIKDEEVGKIIEEIIQDQINYGVVEIPEDFELNNDIRNR